jgi:superfamily II DNA or RNA helicase
MLRGNLPELVTEAVYARGVEYYRQGRIKKYQVGLIHENYYRIDAVVAGTENYHVTIQIGILDSELDIDSHCECPYDWEELCKHSVAVIYKFLTESLARPVSRPQEPVESVKGFQQLRQLTLDLFEDQLSFTYKIKGLIKLSLANFRLTFDCPRADQPLLDSIFDYATVPDSPYHYQYRERNRLLKRLSSFDRLVFEHLRRIQTRKDEDHRALFFAKTPENLQFIITILDNREVFLDETRLPLRKGPKIMPGGSISGDETRVKIQFDTDEFNQRGVYCADLNYLITGNEIHLVDISGISKLPADITIPPEQQGEFLFEILAQLRQNMRLQISPELESHRLQVIEPEISLYFDYREGEVLCEPVIKIKDEVYQGVACLNITNGPHYVRSAENSREWHTINQDALLNFSRFFDENQFIVSTRGIALKGQDQIIQFMLAGFRHLPEDWEIIPSESFANFKVEPIVLEPVVELNMDDAIDWFEFRIYYNLGGKTYSHKEILAMIRHNDYGDSYIQVGQRIFLIEEAAKVDFINKAVAIGEQNPAEHRNEFYNLFFYRQLFINHGVKIVGNKLYNELDQQLSSQNLVEVCPIPAGLQGELRPYQQEGYFWLRFLHKYKLGGILADDMGLGKTVQVLTLIKSLPKDGPVLVVCPRSLLYNWAAEIEKFYPETAYLVYHGAPGEREQLQAGFSRREIIITTYDLINRDHKQLQDFRFEYCILDEAQHIKNHQTQRARMIKTIRARHRLVMTGTPIENSLDELWSIFDFLMPGYLGSKQKFTIQYVTPIKKNGDKEALNLLKLKVAPFILRRRKEEVLKELPEKVISLQKVLMTKLQEDIYRTILEQVKQEVLDSINNKGLEGSQITILAALTRLRQVCNHPGLVSPEISSDIESGKVESLMELVFEAIDSGHKMVIFSQFVKMLKIVESKFREAGISYEYLDGSTHDRIERINRFNDSPDISAFLISLKAGGVGINLTSADIVIHIDPWWNPMVENQATDRVHRIGQKNQVMVYKLITTGTIEEKMLLLQNRKKSVFEAIIENNQDPVHSLTWEDIRGLFEL